MKWVLIISVLSLFACEEPAAKTIAERIQTMELDSTNTYGAMPTLAGEPIRLTQAVSRKQFKTPIRLVGTVTNSCKKKGCWMTIQDGDHTVRVTFKDYGFFVPLEFTNREVVIEGILEMKEMPEEMAKHLAKDEGKSKEEIAKISGNKMELSFVATSVVAI